MVTCSGSPASGSFQSAGRPPARTPTRRSGWRAGRPAPASRGPGELLVPVALGSACKEVGLGRGDRRGPGGPERRRSGAAAAGPATSSGPARASTPIVAARRGRRLDGGGAWRVPSQESAVRTHPPARGGSPPTDDGRVRSDLRGCPPDPPPRRVAFRRARIRRRRRRAAGGGPPRSRPHRLRGARRPAARPPPRPAPGPRAGADPLGRTASLLVDLPVDRQPAGWRFVDAPGRDAARADAFLRADLDELAEAADGWTGPLAVSVVGPWSLLASVELNRGERSVSDPGARRDVVASLAEGCRGTSRTCSASSPGRRSSCTWRSRRWPPSWPDGCPPSPGTGRCGPSTARRSATACGTSWPPCARRTPSPCSGSTPRRRRGRSCARWGRRGGARRPRPRPGRLGVRRACVEDGLRLWAGALPVPARTGLPVPSDAAVVDAVRQPWRRIGLPATALADVVLMPATGSPTRRRPSCGTC